MNRGLSIIIPARNESGVIRRTLASLPLHDPMTEVLVVGGGSDDMTGEAIRELSSVRYLQSPQAQRATQCNLGMEQAQHDRLLFLHADTTLTPGCLMDLHEALDTKGVSGGCFRLRLTDCPPRFRVTAWGANFRTRVMRLPYGDQGIFCRKTDLRGVGGFPPIDLMDDVVAIRRLQTLGRFIMLPHYVTTSARRIVRHGVVKNAVRNYSIVMAYLLGVAPDRLGRWYRKSNIKGESNGTS